MQRRNNATHNNFIVDILCDKLPQSIDLFGLRTKIKITLRANTHNYRFVSQANRAGHSYTGIILPIFKMIFFSLSIFSCAHIIYTYIYIIKRTNKNNHISRDWFCNLRKAKSRDVFVLYTYI